MRKFPMTKRFLLCILSIVVFLTFCPLSSVAEISYNADAAVLYASNHWDDGVGKCAQFVSTCLYQGGLECAYKSNGDPYISCYKLRDALMAVGFQEKELVLTSGGALYSNNSHLIQKGDPIFWRCETCVNTDTQKPTIYPHAAIYTGETNGGYLSYYAHNDPANKKQLFTWNCEECSQTMSIVSLRMETATGQFNFTFYKNGNEWNNNSFGLKAYVINNTSGKKYTLSQHPNYAYTYQTDNTLPYGDYTLWADDGAGTMADQGTVTLSSAEKWKSIHYYTLSFSGNGGSGTAPGGITRLKGQTAALPGKGSLAKTNCQFRGWSEKTSGSPWFVAGHAWTVTEQKTFYASWRQLVTAYVTVKKNGTTWTDCGKSMELRNSSGDTYYLYRQSDGRYRASNIPTGTYDIYVASDGSSGLVKTDSATFTQSNANTTVNYYTVYYSGEGYDYGEEPATHICAANASISVLDQGDLAKVGHTFCYWVSSLTNSIVKPGSTYTITGQQVLRAYWIEGDYRLGDVDHDGVVTSTDANLVLRYYGGKLTAADLDVLLADYDQDGAVTSTDARFILQHYVGKTLASDDQLLLNSTGKPITWDDLDWSLLDWDAIDWDNFSFADLIDMLTAGNRNPDHEIM